MRHARTLAALTALVLSVGGCGLGCRDIQEIRLLTVQGFSVARVGAPDTTRALLHGYLHHSQRGRDGLEFERLFDVFANDARESRNVLVTMNGSEMPPGSSPDRITVSLSLPGRVQRGDRLRVTGTFPPPAQRTPEWGFRTPTAPGEAEVGFTRSRAQIPNPPYDYAPFYTATTASGTITVLHRDRGTLGLELDLTVADASGVAYRVRGPAALNATTSGQECRTIS